MKAEDPVQVKPCTKCGETKALEEFYRDRSRRDGLTAWCRTCVNSQGRRYREANSEKRREKNRRWRAANPDKTREHYRRYREANQDKVREGGRRYREANPERVSEVRRRYRDANPERVRETQRNYREANLEKVLESQRRQRDRVRNAVFDHYGRSCGCCGSTEDLTIDHVNGDGKQHREELGLSPGQHFYIWLVANDFPDEFQTLCRPCNTSKGTGDHCRLEHGECAA